MKRKVSSLLISTLLALTVVTVVPPDFVSPMATVVEELITGNLQGEQVMPFAEKTIWYTRIYDGRLQKRLWSITNRCWLTDWMDC